MNGDISTSTGTLNFIKEYKEIDLKDDIKSTSIVILTYNQLEYTKLCIESIRKFTPNNCYEIIIVDNKSTDGTVEWLKEQNDLKVIFNDRNLGFPVGCNQGMEIAKGDSVVLLNNDTIVTPNWLEHLNAALYSHDNIGGVGAITNSCSNGQQIAVAYINIEQMINLSKEIYMLNEGKWDYKSKLVGFCYMIKKEVLNKTGFLDPIFTPGNYEDDDISLRILKAGYNLLLCKDTFIHHFGSVSFNKNMPVYSAYLNINRMKLNQKWGFDLTRSNSIRYDLIDMMSRDNDNAINVLDIGCGTGATLVEIKNKFRNASIYGIEVDEKAAEIAKGISNTLVGNVETMELNYRENFFDYIILGDVLQYLIDPWQVLRKIVKYLKPTGDIIASIPNLNHISVVRGIIDGKFSYTNEGLLDKSHLRFFTLEEIHKLFNLNGYEIIQVNNNNIFVNPSDTELINQLCKLSNKNITNEYYAYQYFIRANKIIDAKRYNEKELVKLKYMLMRLDNNLDSNEAMEYIFNMYNEDKDYFCRDIVYLINNNIINKIDVLNKIITEAIATDNKEIIDNLRG